MLYALLFSLFFLSFLHPSSHLTSFPFSRLLFQCRTSSLFHSLPTSTTLFFWLRWATPLVITAACTNCHVLFPKSHFFLDTSSYTSRHIRHFPAASAFTLHVRLIAAFFSSSQHWGCYTSASVCLSVCLSISLSVCLCLTVCLFFSVCVSFPISFLISINTHDLEILQKRLRKFRRNYFQVNASAGLGVFTLFYEPVSSPSFLSVWTCR